MVWGATILLLAWGLVPAGSASGTAARLRETLRSNLLSRADYDRMERGYYEQLLDAGRTLGEPLATRARPPGGGPALVCEFVADLREVVLRPSFRVIQPVGVSWSTNARGMRDQTYALAKPSGTYRVAMAGDSIGAGWGVADGLGFEPRLERALDAWSRSRGGPPVEFLNFAVPGRSPGQRWAHFRKLAWERDPDLVLFEATQADVGWDGRQLPRLLKRGLAWDSGLYREVLPKAGLLPGGTIDGYRRALRPHDWELTAGVYRVVARECRARGVPSVWVLLPRVGRPVENADRQRLIGLARQAGFTAVVDLSDSFDGLDPAGLTARVDDYHPNAKGHELLARGLYDVFRNSADLIPSIDRLALESQRYEPPVE